MKNKNSTGSQLVEDSFRGAFETSAIGMAIVSLEGGWLKVNQSLLDIVGYKEKELLKLTFQDITHPDDLEIDLKYVKQMIEGEIPHYKMEKRYYHKDGHIVWILLSVSMVRDEKGEPLYFVSQIQDITDEKNRKLELEHTNALHNQFLKTISHQLRTPLSTAKWNLESMISRVEADPKDFDLELLKSIYASHSQVSRRLSDILLVLDVDQKNIGLILNEVSFSDLLMEVLNDFDEMFKEHNIRVKSDISDCDWNVRVDEAKMRKSLWHLIFNASLYTESGDITVKLSRTKKKIKFEVADQGIGIPPGEQIHIFEKFFRASNAFDLATDRSGIGLFIVKSFIEAHGGEIGFRSTINHGSTFFFTLPVA